MLDPNVSLRGGPVILKSVEIPVRQTLVVSPNAA
jgi:hypothetical protein